MALKIQKAETIIKEAIVTVLYAFPNAGKSTLALTSHKPLTLDFDRGVHRAGNKKGKDVVEVTSWHDVVDINPDDLKPYSTIIIDTVGKCLDVLGLYIIEEDPKCGAAGTLNLKGYGQLKAKFDGFLNLLRGMGKDVVLVAHIKEEMKGDRVVERIVAAGSSKDIVYQSADLMGRIFIRDDGKRVISFDPSDTSYGKNIGLPVFDLDEPGKGDDNGLAKIIAMAKKKINEAAMQETEAADKMQKMRDWIDKREPTAEVFNASLRTLSEKDAPPAIRKYLIEVATKAGLVWNGDEKSFSEKSEQQGETDDFPA